MPFPAMLREDYWESYEFQDDDLNFIYNHLLEIETPQTPQELLRAIVEQRIRKEKKALASKRQAGGILYIPKESYAVGQKLVFPALQWQLGEVVASRQAVNPDLPRFLVLDVTMAAGEKRSFASELELHNLNESLGEETDDPGLNPEDVLRQHGRELMHRMTAALEANPELVRIAGRWFPRSLVVDINIGHMNLAEALLDMEAGGPVPISSILEQVELLTDVNHKLTEFSLNLALQEDGRFDEVGPAGEVMWYLRRLEPEAVKNIPVYLRYQPAPSESETVGEPENLLPAYVIDELDNSVTDAAPNEAIVSLILPHWRAGTLPLAGSLFNLFPTAHESPRIRFTFIAPESGESFPGWVVRQSKYVYGLSEWYAEQGLMPGSLIYLRRSKNQGEIIISTEKRRSTRDW
ncbi:MAG: hypothetical protein U1B80_04610, partial [Anaerolineaceae bacterium]|nr:hypothetical protein [Anaerolineaceae bacterium]